MEVLPFSPEYNDCGNFQDARKRRRIEYHPVQYQEISPPLTELTDSTPEAFVQHEPVPQPQSSFSVGDTNQALHCGPATSTEHMWMDAHQSQYGFSLESWRPDTPNTQSEPVNDAMSMHCPDHRFTFEYPQQAAPNAFAATDFGVPPSPFGIDQLLTSNEPPLRASSSFQMPFLPSRPSNSSVWPSDYSAYQTGPFGSRYFGGMSQEEQTPINSVSEPLAALQLYQEALRKALNHASRNELRHAASALREASERLGTDVDTLRLYQTVPFPGPVAEPVPDWAERRQELLANFSHCWLGILQKQKDLTTAKLKGEKIPAAQTRISTNCLEKLGSEVLIPLCDKFYPKGLVDWHGGVWEERIVDILLECRELGEELDRQRCKNKSSDGCNG